MRTLMTAVVLASMMLIVPPVMGQGEPGTNPYDTYNVQVEAMWLGDEINEFAESVPANHPRGTEIVAHLVFAAQARAASTQFHELCVYGLTQYEGCFALGRLVEAELHYDNSVSHYKDQVRMLNKAKQEYEKAADLFFGV